MNKKSIFILVISILFLVASLAFFLYVNSTLSNNVDVW